MFGKTPVTALQEYCAKKAIQLPEYTFNQSSTLKLSFVCTVSALGEMAEGVGRNKKEAKHDASANLIKKIKFSHPDIQNIPQAPYEAIPTSDAIADLRDLCLQEDHPLPFFDIVQQAGPPEAPEFTAECRVASIRRFATASTKKAAKQKAAQEIIRIIRHIMDKDKMEVALIDNYLEKEEAQTRKLIKTYRELIESDIKIDAGTKIQDRHKYFEKLEPELRHKAKEALNDSSIFSPCEKVHAILNALQIKHKTRIVPANNIGQMVLFELLCSLDVLFADEEDKIYSQILDYFQDML